MAGENNTSISQLNTGCSATAYEDYNVLTPVNLNGGQSYNFTISSSYYSASNGDYCAVWIDFNNDGAFSATERVVTYNTFVPDGAGSNIPMSIPPSAAPGVPRMRVGVFYPVGTNNIAIAAQDVDPCNDLSGTY